MKQCRAIPIDPTQAGPDGFVYGWYTEAYTESSNYRKVGPHINWISKEIAYEVEVLPHTVGQYVTTKNKQNIYAGDIVKCYHSENLRDEGKFTGEVVWDAERVRFKIVEIRPYKWGDSEVAGEIINFEDAEEIEIIGSIHDNEQEMKHE